MFDCYRAEITVILFTGHSLPVHQSDCTVGFYLVPYCQPSPPAPMEYATSASLEWHVWPGRRSIYNTNILVYQIYLQKFQENILKYDRLSSFKEIAFGLKPIPRRFQEVFLTVSLFDKYCVYPCFQFIFGVAQSFFLNLGPNSRCYELCGRRNFLTVSSGFSCLCSMVQSLVATHRNF